MRSLALAVAVLVAGVLGAVAAETTAPAPTDTTPVTIAVTGDIYKFAAKDVSDVILAHASVSAVLLAGDTDNANIHTIPVSDYQEIYTGSYDRFMSKIYPCPGNHDSRSTPPFSTYCQFWGAVAHCPQMYYSFDLGSWHIVSLDSVTYANGGTKATAQLDWLKADLAARPQKPIFAYWHYPLFSRAGVGGRAEMKPFWDVLYARGPAIVLNGHNHLYERYPPLDPEGKPVAESKGIQEFLVTPGGGGTLAGESKLTGPPSAKFHAKAQHVGFFTLYVDGGYRYTIDAVERGGTTTVVDGGAGNLLGGPRPKDAQ